MREAEEAMNRLVGIYQIMVTNAMWERDAAELDARLARESARLWRRCAYWSLAGAVLSLAGAVTTWLL